MKKVYDQLNRNFHSQFFLDTEKEDDDNGSQQRTPTDQTHGFINTDPKTIQKSAERVADWKINCTLIESKIVASDNDEQQEYLINLVLII